ncbi:hypothetical protein SACE_6747 [Saccharopolyspora erythraea NRRL 2338]|uniref:Uncharacterized protein n=1 Tax=Saccharopolyspora erythraea (strain ATCC 11635 / DSM 40517 / JCM 4748 / NBRC 13426 / NCIMB 8594 / NRRL 2338) TaxID=405948 RepID=A4FPD8_SACEN|nr:hypothetical protein SACE_6747 [Saccharopolyspora erythraea NRRL 2338]
MFCELELGAAHAVELPYVFDRLDLPALHAPVVCSAAPDHPPGSPRACTARG